MKTLFLLRHAKSSWNSPGLGDFDRPLAPRGRKAAPKVARHMHKRSYVPDLVLCSAARRARETWDLMSPELKATPETRFERAIYGAGPAGLIDLIGTMPDKAASLLVVGHNPTLQALASSLAGTGDEDSLAHLNEHFPTAALAAIAFEIERWEQVREGGGELIDYVRPREL